VLRTTVTGSPLTYFINLITIVLFLQFCGGFVCGVAFLNDSQTAKKAVYGSFKTRVDCGLELLTGMDCGNWIGINCELECTIDRTMD